MAQRMINLASRIFPAAVALAALIATGSAALAQSDASAHATKRQELEKAVMDITHMFQTDPRYNKGKTPEEIKDGVEFVTGNVLFILGHETGHALISVFELPVLGREEDAADALASVIALKMGNAFADRVIVNAAKGWFLSDQRDKKKGVPTLFYDEHGLDVQRAYNIVCLMVGGAKDKFTEFAQEVKLPKARQNTCQFDYSNAEWSWEESLKPHKRKPEDPKTTIEVSYGPTTEFATIAELARKLQILETVAEWLSEDFVWTKPISIEMKECGKADARWLPGPKKIYVCYEIIRELIQLHRNFGHAELVPGDMMMSKTGKVVAAGKPTAGKGGSKGYRSERR
jgi:hypothetical protein